MVGRKVLRASFSGPGGSFAASASLQAEIVLEARLTAPSSESLRVSLLAGWAVTLPRRGVDGEVDGGRANAVGPAAAKERISASAARKTGAPAGRRQDVALFTDHILSDEASTGEIRQ